MLTKSQQSTAHPGSGYDWPASSYDAELVSVGKGTPEGERLRRYWHPIALSSQVKNPRYGVLEDLDDEQHPLASSANLSHAEVLPCNWCQFYENTVDPYHVFILHSIFSTRNQFPERRTGA